MVTQSITKGMPTRSIGTTVITRTLFDAMHKSDHTALF